MIRFTVQTLRHEESSAGFKKRRLPNLHFSRKASKLRIKNLKTASKLRIKKFENGFKLKNKKLEII